MEQDLRMIPLTELRRRTLVERRPMRPSCMFSTLVARPLLPMFSIMCRRFVTGRKKLMTMHKASREWFLQVPEY